MLGFALVWSRERDGGVGHIHMWKLSTLLAVPKSIFVGGAYQSAQSIHPQCYMAAFMALPPSSPTPLQTKCRVEQTDIQSICLTFVYVRAEAFVLFGSPRKSDDSLEIGFENEH